MKQKIGLGGFDLYQALINDDLVTRNTNHTCITQDPVVGSSGIDAGLPLQELKVKGHRHPNHVMSTRRRSGVMYSVAVMRKSVVTSLSVLNELHNPYSQYP